MYFYGIWIMLIYLYEFFKKEKSISYIGIYADKAIFFLQRFKIILKTPAGVFLFFFEKDFNGYWGLLSI